MLPASTVSKVENAIEDKQVLRLSQELIRIPSVYRNEARISKFILRKLEGWGIASRSIDVPGYGPNVAAWIGEAKRPSVVLNGHMDTVDVVNGWKHDPFGAIVEKGYLYGLGALDMKCGLAAMMVAFRALAESGATGGSRICLQAVSGEEHTGTGTRVMIDRGEFRRARAVIVGEGIGGLEVITNGRRGGSYYDIEFVGRAAHGAYPHLGINAVVDASKAACALSEMRMRRSRGLLGDDLAPLEESQTVLRMSGGTDTLSVPDRCTMRIVRSTVPGTDVDIGPALLSVIRKQRLRSRVEMKFLGSEAELYHPFLTPARSRLVKVTRKWVNRYTGKMPRLVCGKSEADDNLIAHSAGVPVISVGPGEGGKRGRYHQAEEAISVSQLGAAARIYAMTALELSRSS